MGRILLVVAVALGAALAGVGIWCSTDERPASFGWVAFAPLSHSTYVVPIGPPAWATALVVAGSLVVGAAVALLLTRRWK